MNRKDAPQMAPSTTKSMMEATDMENGVSGQFRPAPPGGDEFSAAH
jgi:hypothetical protein